MSSGPYMQNPQGGIPVNAALHAAGAATPMYGGNAGPRYTGPANIQMGEYGMLLQMAMPAMMQMAAGSNRVPTQFFPEQNVYDQLKSTYQYNSRMQAVQMAAERDARTMERTLGGATQMFTGKPLTDMERARNYEISNFMQGIAPFAVQMAPDLYDKLHGSRGSAAVFADQMYRAMRTSVDPLTGAAGYRGDSTARVSNEVFERLFGSGADLSEMKGLSAGQAGLLANELQLRGLMGRPTGTLSLREQRAAVPTQLADAVVDRLARELPEIRDAIREGKTPTEDMLNSARQQIRTTHGALKDAGREMTRQDLEQMPGAEAIIQTTDADRITKRLKNMSGAVKAMKDIFGDQGNPNAPMREIINALDALTQGGLATMSPGQLESIVRKTQSIAQQTGMGLDSIIGLTTQNAGLADQLGLDRSFAITTAQQSALYGAAVGDVGGLDIPVWGAMSKEQLVLADSQLRMHAAASPFTNQLNAVMRMADTGMVKPKEGTELAAMIDAIRKGDRTYSFGGQQKSFSMNRVALTDIITRDAGITGNEVESIIYDRYGNQEYGQKYNTDLITRGQQAVDVIDKFLAPGVGGRLSGVMEERKINESLIQAGVVKSDNEFRQMMQQVGAGVSRDFLKMDPVTRRNADSRQAAMAASVRANMRAALKARMPNASDAQIDAQLQAVVNQVGGDAGLNNLGVISYAEMDQVAFERYGKSAQVFADLHDPKIQKEAAARRATAEVEAEIATVMANFGTSGPLQRVVDAIQNADENTKLTDVLKEAMGGVDKDKIKGLVPDGALDKIFGMVAEIERLNPDDDKDRVKIRKNLDVIQGWFEGGEAAQNQLDKLGKGDGDLRRLLQDAAGRDGSKGKESYKQKFHDVLGEEAFEEKHEPIDISKIDRASLSREEQMQMATIEQLQSMNAFIQGNGGLPMPDNSEKKFQITIKSGKLKLNKDGTAEIEGDGEGQLGDAVMRNQ